jgi:biotin-(acetyl-CoA carboxylase) ligase
LQLAKELCRCISDACSLLVKVPSQLAELYHQHLYKLNESVRLKQGSRVFDATLKDVSMQGELIVQHAIEERFRVGEVEWVI